MSNIALTTNKLTSIINAIRKYRKSVFVAIVLLSICPIDFNTSLNFKSTTHKMPEKTTIFCLYILYFR